MNLASEFGENCLIAALDEVVAGPSEAIGSIPPAGSVRELEHAFSSLRIPTVMMRKGDFAHALEHLEKQGAFCFPLCNGKRCSKGPLGGCAGSGNRFVGCNPAFARDGGGDDLKQAAREMQLSLLLKMAEQNLISQDVSIEDSKKLWSRASEAAKACGRAVEATERIKTMVLARVSSLYKSKQRELAQGLLEAAIAISPHEDLENEMALLATDTAIQIANDRDDFVTATEMLRKAYRMSPHQPRVKKSFITALRVQANRTFESDSQKCLALLDEGWQVGAKWLAEDRFNDELVETMTDLEHDYMNRLRELAAKCLASSEDQAARYLRDALRFGRRALGRVGELISAIAGELAMVTAGIGIALANKNSSDDRSAGLLRAARMLDPDSRHVTRNLMVVLHGQAIRALERQQAIGALGSLNSGNNTIALIQEAVLAGKTWLGQHYDAEIRDLVDKMSADLNLLLQRQPSRRWGSTWPDLLDAPSLSTPTVENALELLERQNLLR
jgi:tetratricopeptide (TPR) repeat protein